MGFVAPVADAGGPYPVVEGSTVSLDGSGSSGTQPLTYGWTGSSSLDDPTSASPEFVGLDDGTTTLLLGVADADGVWASNDTTVETTNAEPDASLTLSATSVAVGTSVNADVAFSDVGVLDTHIVAITWGDSATSAPRSPRRTGRERSATTRLRGSGHVRGRAPASRIRRRGERGDRFSSRLRTDRSQ